MRRHTTIAGPAAADLSAVASDPPMVPAPPVTPPTDSPPSSNGHSAVADLPSRPDSPPIQDETPKHRRFSMLRFRNASDSQLSARAKQQAQALALAEKPPPVPRRTCFAALSPHCPFLTG